MAVHSEQVRETSGMAKEVDEGAWGMILDNLQRSQYQYPVKSTARELASNAVDSIAEKLFALKILSGEAKIEDFYATLEDDTSGVYKDSKWDATYYDPAWLDADNNRVQIIYQEGGNTQKDLLRIIDKGVGLGGKRLQGYMKLGYSTKRLGKKQLGKYGIGAKAGLSTGVKHYTTITNYNGKRFRFNIYSDNVDSIVPSMDLATHKENGFEIWQRKLKDGSFEDHKVYYEETTEKNGVEVQVEFKKHYKQDLIAAVQSQLLYFENVDFEIIQQDGYVSTYPVQAKVLYRDDKILISRNNQFSKPHIIINNVAYGYVDFLELEIENKQGNIGIIVSPEEVDVSPSREYVLWTELTRETIVNRFKEVVDIASKLVEQKLMETDFIKWLRTCISTLSSSTYGSTDDEEMIVIRELSNVVDTTALKPTYSQDKSVKYFASGRSMLKGLDARVVTKTQFYRGNKTIHKVKREDVKMMHEFGNRPIFLQKGNSNNRKDLFLLSLYPDGFISLKDYEDDEELDTFISDKTALIAEGETPIIPTEDLKGNINKMLTLFKSSTEIQEYGEVEVPKDFNVDEETEEEVVEEEKEPEIVYANDQERRKAQGKIVAATPSFRSTESHRIWQGAILDKEGNITQPSGYYPDPDHAAFTWLKVEPYLADIDTLDDAELYYGTSTKDEEGSKSDENLLFLATAITRKESSYGSNWVNAGQEGSIIDTTDGYYPEDVISMYSGDEPHLKYYLDTGRALAWYGKPTVRLVRVSQQNVKHFRDTHSHIQQFFLRIDKKIITMSHALVQWNTARYIHEHIEKLAFMENYSLFNPDIALKYADLKAYHNKYYREIDSYNGRGFDSGDIASLKSHADKVLELQLYVRSNPDDTAGIGQLATDLFSTPEGEVTNGIATELPIYDTLNELLDYAEPIKVLLNSLPVLTETDDTLTILADLEAEIKFYIIQKRGEL